MSIGGYFMRPESRGIVQIKSPDPAVRPYINANQLTADADVRSSISLFHWIRRLARQPALAPWLVSEITPGPKYQSDDEIIDAFLRFGSTAYHVCGTVRMGSDKAARSIRSCACAASRMSASPTLRSCRRSCPAIPMPRPW